MKTIDYSHKPPQIQSVSDLITFFSGIPEDAWCVGLLQDDAGNRCALGHHDAAYGFSALGSLKKFGPDNLVYANNGVSDWRDRNFASPQGAKARVLAYLRSLEPTSRPSPSVLNQVATLASVTTPCP